MVKFGDASIILFVCGYILAASGEVWLTKLINYNWDANVPTLMAMMVNAYWPIQLIIYYQVRKTQPPPDRAHFPWGIYFFMGCSGSAVSLSRSIGISNLSGVVYVITSNTEIVFSALLSVLVLKKELNRYQYLGVALVIGAVVFAVWDPESGGFDSGEQQGSDRQFVVGIVLTIASRFLSSLQSVIAEKSLGSCRKSPWGVNEIAIAQALGPSIMLPITLLWSNEQNDNWPDLVADGNPSRALLGFILGVVAITKLVDRLCKMSIISHKSTVFFGGVDAFMKSIAGFGAFLMFQSESFAWNEFVSLFIVMIALGFTIHGESIAKVVTKTSKQIGKSFDNLMSGAGLSNGDWSIRSLVGASGTRSMVNNDAQKSLLSKLEAGTHSKPPPSRGATLNDAGQSDVDAKLSGVSVNWATGSFFSDPQVPKVLGKVQKQDNDLESPQNSMGADKDNLLAFLTSMENNSSMRA